MAAAGGLSAQFGMADETTFGTVVTPTRFLEFNSETLEQTIDRVSSSGLRVGRKTPRTSQYVAGRKSVQGDVDIDFQQQGMGLLLKHMLGTVTSAQPNVGSAPTAWEHTFKVGALDAKSFTCQIGAADVGLVQRAFTYAGCKVAKADLSAAVDGVVNLKVTLDGVSESTAVGMAAATYATNTTPLVWTGGVITLPGGATGNVKKFDLSIDNGQKVDRWFLGSAVKKEQLEANERAFTGTMDIEFTDLSAYGLFTASTTGSMTAFFTGANIASIYNYALEVTLPGVRFDGKTADVSGADIITVSVPFVALDDGSGTTPVQMVYRTTDTSP